MTRWNAICFLQGMTTRSIFASALLAITLLASAQPRKPIAVDPDTVETHALREHTNSAFQIGERLTYTVHYGWIDAGEAVMEVKDSPYDFGDRKAYHVVGTGKSIGSFDWFYKVRDRFETYIDQEGMFPHYFVRDCDEGGYKIDQKYRFFPEKSLVVTHQEDTLATPDFVQDMISAYYYARTLDFSDAQPGDIYTIMTMVDEEIYPLQIKYTGKETIKIRKGKFRCMKFAPVVQEGRIFKSEDDLSVWITDDANKIPVLVKADLLVGSLKMEMTEWTGLANELAKVK